MMALFGRKVKQHKKFFDSENQNLGGRNKVMRNTVLLTLFVLVGLTWAAPVWGQVCVSPPAGLVAWWPGDTNANDIVGGNCGTLENGATVGNPGKVGGAFQFNGMDGGGGVNLGNVPAFDFTQSSSFTIEAWVNSLGVTVPPNDGQVIVILNYNCSNTVQALGIQAGTERVFFQVRDANGVSAGGLFSPTALSKNTFHHVVGVREVVGITRTLSLYVDGVLVASAADPTTGALAINTPDLIGRRIICGTTNTFNGLIDEVSIYNRALTEAEIAAIFAAGSAGKCRCEASLAQANQTIQSLQAQVAPLQTQVAQLQTQLSQAQQQNTQLQNQITQSNATIANLQNQVTSLTAQNTQLQGQVNTLTQQNTQLQNQLTQLNTTLNNGLTAMQADFRHVFRNPHFTIPGSTASQKYQSVIQAILLLNHGRKQGIYVNLGGRLQ